MKCFDCGLEFRPHEEVNYRGTTPVHAGHLACIAALKARLSPCPQANVLCACCPRYKADAGKKVGEDKP
jgi:hypothetical protein